MKEKTLYIIGNGFDIAHGIQSEYKYFYNYLREYDERFLNSLSGIYPRLFDDVKLWCSFEKELSNYCIPDDIEDVALDQMKSLESYQEGDIDYGAVGGFIEHPINANLKIIKKLKANFNLWVGQIDISNCENIFYPDKDSIFLTFNYTNTLEKIYNIEDARICHIHGKIGDPDLIIGHCCDYDKKDYSEELFPSMKSIIDPEFRTNIIGKLEKRCYEVINNNEDFFDNIEDVTKIEIIGHSLSEVDMPYFIEISERIGSEVTWNIGYYINPDNKKILNLKSKLKLKDYNCNLFEVRLLTSMIQKRLVL
ncbi:bacteriophage abortive infection AbiH family protein [Macellibacteroides fermentans]|uniref:bacteriophage abortive infection AbiH family protein n=1 Tax=Macellibacteroides fermentans TaxID=879969 RepID=UPI003B9329B1